MDETDVPPPPILQTRSSSGELSPEEQRIHDQTERMRLRRETRTKQVLAEEPEELIAEEAQRALPLQSHTFVASADHVVFHAERDVAPVEDRFVVAAPVPLPPVFAVPLQPDSDSENDDRLTDAEKEQRARLKRMEERRLRKHAEEEVLRGYVEVSSSSVDQEEKKTAPSNDEPVHVYESKVAVPQGGESKSPNEPTEPEVPALRIVLPPEAARPQSRPTMTTMRAVLREGLMGLTLTFKTGVPISLQAPLDCRLVVRVLAASINPVDYKLPKLLGGPGVGLDFAGKVVAVRPDTTPFKVGDEVYGNADGCLAEYVFCEATKINLKPKLLTAVEAAAMPTTYLSALQGLRKYLQKGQNVLVIGASGGCGLAAVQIARKLGALEIVGVCSAKNAELVRQQGATRVIDYNVDKVSTVYQKWGSAYPQRFYDVVFDAATGSGGKEDYNDEAQKVLKPGGKYVCLNGSVSVWLRKFANYQRSNQDLIVCEHSSADLAVLTEMVEAVEEKGPLFRPVIARVLPFDEQNVKAAFDLLKSRRATGKIVLQMEERATSSSTAPLESLPVDSI